MTQEYIPFPQIVSALTKLCEKRVTGNLFVATKANRSAQLILDKGKIVFVYFFNKRGEEALELMSTIRAGRYRFQEGNVSRRMPLPATEAILKSLSGGQKLGATDVSASSSTAPGLSQEQKNTLEACLAGYIGPMAGLICEDHLGEATDLQAAIDALAAEIPSPAQAQKFRAMVMDKLG
ncbi:DUF4388 domain-containing protein [Desulfopila sp. IMCC35006]|uniref:DUF4388 domain-containing protein n=1 Tax=Desulfopila sp. IMCC35006 TaxID=2569542 RepID=UPI0010AC339D|nr:DUF4388 domain-containing protein [Desulfopila sp. IMCC35006]TKB26173.1 DUF4388 domain-containing protein [Desulfopila sp. IMCC35006]